MRHTHAFVALAALATLLLASPLSAAKASKRVTLDASLAQPTLIADQKQTTYLKVALTGFEMDTDAEPAPVNLAIVLDKSGSMSGDKIAKAREAAVMAIGRLRNHDIVSVVAYSHTVEVVVPATKAVDREAICRKVRSITTSGNTALFAGVSKGAAEVRKFLSDNRVNRVILLSDGLANSGPSTPAELGSLGLSLGKEGMIVSTIGLGLGYNEDLMTRLAESSDGQHFFAEEARDLARVFDSEFGAALSVVAQKARIEIVCAPGVRPVRILNRNGDIVGQKVTVSINELFSEHEKYLILEVETSATEDGASRRIASVTATYDNLSTGKRDKISAITSAHFTKSKEVAAKSVDKKAMADAVMQIAVLNNERATKLRDEGKIDLAIRVIDGNTMYLYSNADSLSSEELRSYGHINAFQGANFDDANWGKNRKEMRESQSVWRIQQKR